jgi:hypothetical protein
MTKSTKGGPRYVVLAALSILLLVLAAITVLPYSGSHFNLLGYRSICSFVPLSTLILLAAAGLVRIVRDMEFR